MYDVRSETMVTEPKTVSTFRAQGELSLQGVTRTVMVLVRAVPFMKFESTIVVVTT